MIAVMRLLQAVAFLGGLLGRWLTQFMDEVDDVWDLTDPFLTGEESVAGPAPG